MARCLRTQLLAAKTALSTSKLVTWLLLLLLTWLLLLLLLT